jgi:hypothetical protein
MRTVLSSAVLVFIVSTVCGCTWQANRSSEAVQIDPGAIGSGQSVFAPANGWGYVDGEAMDMRSKR